MREVEEDKRRRLEWRAQWRLLEEVPARREKSEQQRVEKELVRVVHTEENEHQMEPRLRKTFWEKLGFTDRKKQDTQLQEARDKVDHVFKQLRQTMHTNYELQQQLQASKHTIKEQETRKHMLRAELERQRQMLASAEAQIEVAEEQREEEREHNGMWESEKREEKEEAERDLGRSKELLGQEYETARMRQED